MASHQKQFYPYHFPRFADNRSTAYTGPDPAFQDVIDAMYVDQTCSFEFEKATQKPRGPDEDHYQFLSVYPTTPHPNAPHPCLLKEIFNEDEQPSKGCNRRDLYQLHKDWRQIGDTMTKTIDLKPVRTFRPFFTDAFASFTSAYDTITIKEIWGFFSLLLDVVLEAFSNKLLSGELSTKSTAQQAEQTLLGIGTRVKPLVHLYGRICQSELFRRHLVCMINPSNTAGFCQFLSMEEILRDAGGLYVFDTVNDFLIAARDAVLNRLDRDSLKIMANYELCSLQFPKDFEYEMILWSDLRRLAFHPIVDGLFFANSAKTLVDDLKPGDEYRIVASSRVVLFCCTAVHRLTGSLFNGVSYDTLAHAYYKRHHHLTLTAEIFGLSATIFMFKLHAVRLGCLSGQTHPIIDPDFSIRDANGELSLDFLDVWTANNDTLRKFGKLYEVPGLDFKFDSNAPIPSTGSHLTPDAIHTTSPKAVRKQRSVVSVMSMGLLGGDKTATSSSAAPNTPGHTATAPLSPLPTPASGQSGGQNDNSSILLTTQAFVNICGLSEDDCLNNDEQDPRFPLLHTANKQRSRRLEGMRARQGTRMGGGTSSAA